MSPLSRNDWLLAGGLLSIAAALAHLACIAGGPDWFRAMGAGERMAQMVEAGRVAPIVITVGIAVILGGFGLYALSGAGVAPRLPLLRIGLVAITIVYLARGLVLFWPAALRRPDLSPGFMFWSSAIVLAIGLIHLVGLRLGWSDLKGVSDALDA